ncbi:MAG: hypothetical protein K8T10_15510 [Candidatus Eremiobacteraeota bacterium]|nr:hypothetical protein [Candidatus Eremiobacteraeota bacterium]
MWRSPINKESIKVSPQFKAEVILKFLGEEQSLSQIASKYGLHPNQLSRQKNSFIGEAAVIFGDENKSLNKLKVDYGLEEYR